MRGGGEESDCREIVAYLKEQEPAVTEFQPRGEHQSRQLADSFNPGNSDEAAMRSLKCHLKASTVWLPPALPAWLLARETLELPSWPTVPKQ